MKSLLSIVNRESLDVPEARLDHFQGRVLQELHLEFFFARCRFLITPHLRHLTMGPATADEESSVASILSERQGQLGQLKRHLIHSLALYSALLETNSYVIALNQHLVIARFVGRGEGFEVKLYTLPPGDLPAQYADKIYLGRTLLVLEERRREHFGLRFMRDSLREQIVKLDARLQKHCPEQLAELRRDFLEDLREDVDEFSGATDAIFEGFPPHLLPGSGDPAALLDLNRRFRELKHLLLEADDVLEEMERWLFERSPGAVRYVIKFRKDVTNDVNYIMFKVNGRISDAVNGIRL